MAIGLYFGSFNPIHIGHLIIANHVLNTGGVQKIWFVVSPQNPFKESSKLLNEYDRLHLVKCAIESDDRLKASNIEFGLPKPSYTAHTLMYLQEKYPAETFKIILGSDSFANIEQWKNADVILNNYELIVYERPGFEVRSNTGPTVHFLKAPLLDISASYVRAQIKQKKSIRYLVPQHVEEEILSNRYYMF